MQARMIYGVFLKSMAFVCDLKKVLSRWTKMSRRKMFLFYWWVTALVMINGLTMRLAHDRAAEVTGHQLPG